MIPEEAFFGAQHACLPCYYKTGLFFLSTCRHTYEDRQEAGLALRAHAEQTVISNGEFIKSQQELWRDR